MTTKIKYHDLVYHITYNCNLSCHGCINHSNHLNSHSIETSKNWKTDLVALSKRILPDRLEILGGEPLLHPDIKDILEHALNLYLGRPVRLNTNGLLLGENTWLWQYLDMHPSFKIQISYHYPVTIKNKYNERMIESLLNFLKGKIRYNNNDEFRDHLEQNLNKPILFLTSDKKVFLNNYYNTSKDTTWKIPPMDNDDFPVPQESDPEAAYKNCICPDQHVVGTKIYKCPMTALLPDVLKLYGKDKDKRWEKLFNYQPYDVSLPHNQELFENLRKPEDVCSLCSANPHSNIKTDKFSKLMKPC